MLPDFPADNQAAMDMGITLYADEAEGPLEVLLRDMWEWKAQSINK